MKSHYKNEQEWMADFNAMMAAREKSSGIPAKLQHSKAIPIARPTAGLAHTKPIPIRRPALPIERKWIRRGELVQHAASADHEAIVMTAHDAIAMLRERRALEKVAAIIRRQTTLGPEWAAVLVAITDRLAWSTYAITVTDPQLVAYAEAVLAAEPDPKSAFTSNDWTSAWEVH